MDGRTIGAEQLIVALFRLAVADYRGLSYGYDEPGRRRRVNSRHRDEAAAFLQGAWAAYLADMINLRSDVIWADAHGLVERSAGSVVGKGDEGDPTARRIPFVIPSA